ncbi:MAG: hypothetical protein R6W70_00735, partial [bacterium]
MKKLLILLTALILAGCGGEELPFDDPGLRKCVQRRLDEVGDTFNIDNVSRIYCGGYNVKKLTGIENLKDLHYIRLNNNPIEDYTGIEQTPLRELHISDMQVVPDLSAIAKI